MNKILLSLVLLIFLIASVMSLDNLRITGNAVTQPISLSAVVTNGPASLFIINPLDSIYLNGEFMLLRYSQSGAESVWFNLDDGENTTLNSTEYYFNASEGEHIINLYANNSVNLITHESFSFVVNSTYLTLIYDEFKNKGETIDFVNFSLRELENLANVTFEIPEYGQIYFYGDLNITDINSSNKNIIDLDSGINIFSNQIYLNSSYLPNLNHKVRVSIRGLSFSNPRILRDGQPCSTSICQYQSYSGGELVFNASGFSTYSVEQTPQNNSNPQSNSGGGGKVKPIASTNTTRSFYVDRDKIYVKIKIGETTHEQVNITNLGYTTQTIYLDFNSAIARLNEREITLAPGETRELTIDFFLRSDSVPDLYINKLSIYNKNRENLVEIPVIVEAISKKSLFDVKVDISEKFKVIEVNDDLVASITLYNLGETGRVDSLIEYMVKDSEGNTVFEESETVAVETRASLVKNINLPKNLDEGEYYLYVKTVYSGESASSVASFSIIDSSGMDITTIMELVVFVLLVIILIRMVVKIKEMDKGKN